MRLDGIEARWLGLSLRSPLHTSAGAHRERPVLMVKVVCGEVVGWGECGALATGTAVDPPATQVWGTLVGRSVPHLLDVTRSRDGALPEAALISGLFDASAADRMAGAALEMAVLDAELRTAGTSLSALLGVRRRTVPAGAVLGIPSDHDVATLLADVTGVVARGFGRVRLKIEPGWDVEPVRAVRSEFPELALQVDANGAYRLGAAGDLGAERLAALDALGLACIEQPLPPDDLLSHVALADLLTTPICLDESITTIQRLIESIDCGACEVACLKPARLGGLIAARRAHDVCLAAGIPAFVGGFFETGLARAANAALAGLPGFTLAGDLSDPADYLVESISPYPAPVAGRVRLPELPGVGAAPDPSLVALHSVEVLRFDPGA